MPTAGSGRRPGADVLGTYLIEVVAPDCGKGRAVVENVENTVHLTGREP
ncbi:hypothetical protein ABZW32_02545 [Streptomyces sp. NPDC004667]